MTATSPEIAFNELAAALRAVGSALEAAVSVRYEPSPGMVRSGDGPANPTLDTVLDPRRAAVSAEVTRATVQLWAMTRDAVTLERLLTSAVLAWEGEPSHSPKTGNPDQ